MEQSTKKFGYSLGNLPNYLDSLNELFAMYIFVTDHEFGVYIECIKWRNRSKPGKSGANLGAFMYSYIKCIFQNSNVHTPVMFII